MMPTKKGIFQWMIRMNNENITKAIAASRATLITNVECRAARVMGASNTNHVHHFP